MIKKKIAHILTLPAPLRHYPHDLENYFGFEWIDIVAFYLNADGQYVGAFGISESGTWPLTGEDFWHFMETFGVKKIDAKANTRALNKLNRRNNK